MTKATPKTPKKRKKKDLKNPLTYQDFIEWSALPDTEKEPRTHQEFAIKNGISNGTLTDWKNREGFWDEVKEKRKVWAKGRTSNVILGLYRRALKAGTASEVKLWLQVFDDFVEHTKQTHDGIGEFLDQIYAKKAHIVRPDRGESKNASPAKATGKGHAKPEVEDKQSLLD
jgi:hypothetical protein